MSKTALSKVDTDAYLSVRTEDIISIAISEIEDSLHNKIKSNTKELEGIAKDINTINEKVSKEIIATSEAMYKDKVVELISAFKKLFPDVTAKEIEVTYGGNWADIFKDTEINLSVHSKGRLNFLVNNKFSINKFLAIKELIADRCSYLATQSRIQKETLELKLKLSDIGRLERKARAAASTVVLNKTEDGKKIMAEIKTRILSTEPLLKQLA